MIKKGVFVYLLMFIGLIVLILAGPMGGVTRARFEQMDKNTRWVSDDQTMWFAFTGNGYQGEFTVNGKTMLIAVGFTYGSRLNVWPEGEKPSDGNTLFYGDYGFRWNSLYIHVTGDKADLFNGELPTFTFTRQEED